MEGRAQLNSLMREDGELVRFANNASLFFGFGVFNSSGHGDTLKMTDPSVRIRARWRSRHMLPSGDNGVELMADWYKDAARSLDYLDTRQEIDRD
jgi:hypothetical protein